MNSFLFPTFNQLELLCDCLLSFDFEFFFELVYLGCYFLVFRVVVFKLFLHREQMLEFTYLGLYSENFASFGLKAKTFMIGLLLRRDCMASSLTITMLLKHCIF